MAVLHLVLDHSHIEYLSVTFSVHGSHSLLQLLLAQPVFELALVFCLRRRLVEVCINNALVVPEFEGIAQIFAVRAVHFQLSFQLLILLLLFRAYDPRGTPRARHAVLEVVVDG